MKNKINIKYQDIISSQNLYQAWREFLLGKKNKEDVAEFALNLSRNIFSLYHDLENKIYTHGSYGAFNISDPKPRNIHKASVRDRLLHHAIYRILYPYFDRLFIYDSYSCRIDKGTHRAFYRFCDFGKRVSFNHRKTCWVLKLDIKKCFASIDQKILTDIFMKFVKDKDVIWLTNKVVQSFSSFQTGKGMPLGNLTSQLLVNIYMNEFDQWIKHRMRVKYYVRYADDFVILSQDKDYLLELIPKIADFLQEELKLTLHPNKIILKTFASGVDFLGWVHFSNHRVLRTSTKRRAAKALKESDNLNKLSSYKGLLSHGNQYQLQTEFLIKIQEIEEREGVELP